MATATRSTHDLVIALHNEVLEGVRDELARNPSRSIFSFRAAQLKSTAGLRPSEQRDTAGIAFYAYQERAEFQRISRDYYCFYEDLPSDDDPFKVTVVIRRPGMYEELIEGCIEKIRATMLHCDVDGEPVAVKYPPLSVYSAMHPSNIAAIFIGSAANEIVSHLSIARIIVTHSDNDTFECRRS